MARIGILTTPIAVERNMEHLVFRVSEILSQHHTVELIGLERCSRRIAERFYLYQPNHALSFIPPLGPILRRTRLLNQYIRARKPDLLMSLSGIGINGLAVAVAGHLHRIPTAARLNSDVFTVYKYSRPVSKKLRLFIKNNVLGRATMRWATKVIVLHKAQAEALTTSMLSRDRLLIGSPPLSFPPLPLTLTKDTARDQLGIPLDAFVVLYVGRIDHDKNFSLFVQVMKRVLRHRNDAYFLLVGDGPIRSALERQHRSDRVHFVGQKPRDALPLYYQASNAFLITSPSEGFSLAIAEALYFNLPVVSTDSGPVPRSLTSNISDDPIGLSDMLISETYARDAFPKELNTDAIRRQWLDIVDQTIGSSPTAITEEC
jgi:glycosyltransferase involved in cell wall biosynthesis